MKNNLLFKIKQAIKNNDIDNAVLFAKKLWGEKGERLIYSDNKHSVDIIYRYRWGFWKGMLNLVLLKYASQRPKKEKSKLKTKYGKGGKEK